MIILNIKIKKRHIGVSYVRMTIKDYLNNHIIRMTMTLPITKVLIIPTFLEIFTLLELR
jgi:hypothetical protein